MQILNFNYFDVSVLSFLFTDPITITIFGHCLPWLFLSSPLQGCSYWCMWQYFTPQTFFAAGYFVFPPAWGSMPPSMYPKGHITISTNKKMWSTTSFCSFKSLYGLLGTYLVASFLCSCSFNFTCLIISNLLLPLCPAIR